MVVRADPADKGRTHIQLPTPSGTDDAAVWQEAIDAAPTGAVLVAKPDPRYRMGTVLSITTNHVVLDLYGSTIQAITAHTGHLLEIKNAADVVIRGGTLDQNRQSTTDGGVTTAQAVVHIDADAGGGVQRFVLRDMVLENGHQSGVLAQSDNRATTPLTGNIENVTVTDMGHRGIRTLRGWGINIVRCNVSDVGNAGIHHEQAKGGTIDKCEVVNAGTHGVLTSGSSTVESVDVHITGCRVTGAGQSGVVAGNNARRFQFIGNRVSGCGDHGVAVDLQLSTSDWTAIPANGVVAGNILNGNISYGIYARVLSDLSVTGNVIWANGLAGVAIQNALYVSCTGNNVFGNPRGFSFSEGTTPNFVASGLHTLAGNSVHDNPTADVDQTQAAALTYDCYLGDTTVMV